MLDDVAEPVTELGKLHHTWVRERGLPKALVHHDYLRRDEILSRPVDGRVSGGLLGGWRVVEFPG